MTTGAFYHHFPSREAYLDALAEHALGPPMDLIPPETVRLLASRRWTGQRHHRLARPGVPSIVPPGSHGRAPPPAVPALRGGGRRPAGPRQSARLLRPVHGPVPGGLRAGARNVGSRVATTVHVGCGRGGLHRIERGFADPPARRPRARRRDLVRERGSVHRATPICTCSCRTERPELHPRVPMESGFRHRRRAAHEPRHVQRVLAAAASAHLLIGTTPRSSRRRRSTVECAAQHGERERTVWSVRRVVSRAPPPVMTGLRRLREPRPWRRARRSGR